MVIGCVYIITNRVNGKQYVGLTRGTIKDRLEYHFKAVDRGYTTHIANAIRKFGKENFSIRAIFFHNDIKILAYVEKLMIIKYDTKKSGYNSTDGGETGGPGKIRGTTHSEETRRKISEGNKGKILSEDHKKKIKETLRKTFKKKRQERIKYLESVGRFDDALYIRKIHNEW